MKSQFLKITHQNSLRMPPETKHIYHIDLCVIEYSLVDAPTASKHVDEVCLHIWHLTGNLYIVSLNLSCELLTDKMNLLINVFLAI